MVGIITTEFVKLAIVHLSDGTSHFVDQNGFSYGRISEENDVSIWNDKWLWAENSEEVLRSLPPGKILIYSLVCAFLILFAGLTSGLNLSLLSIAPLKIKIMEMSSKPYDRKVLSKKKKLFRNKNTIIQQQNPSGGETNQTNCAKPTLFVGDIIGGQCSSNGVTANIFGSNVLISVTFVLIFGEILPQAVLASNPLKAGYYFAWVVRVLQVLTFPVTYPVALLLDKIIKHQHGTVFTHEEMSNLFGIISQDKDTRDQFHKDELLFLGNFCVIQSIDKKFNTFKTKKKKTDGALKLRTLTVEREMVRWKHVKRFPYDLELDDKGLAKIWECGFSRVPVYKEHDMDVVGICLVKDLILVDPNPKPLLGHYVRRKPVIMSPDTTMIQALNLFRERRTHFALITREVDVVNECLQSGKAMPKTVKFLGAITLEDIMEQLIQEEIEDEFDSSFDVKGITIEEQRLVTHQIFHKRPPHNISPKNQRAAIREKRTELKLKQLHQQQQLFKNVIEHGKAGTGTSELVGRSSTHPQEIVDNTNNKSAKGDVILSPEMETDSKEIEIESKSLLGTES
ncbi:CBS domain-containing protein [Reticulomyxa filosa]|uniref:CBS domain-containing protein n=1 Tax=Reticulomyxa filosa TaxID=46433 RepID=X6PBY0_RETFI|nr:CBS domain-containing protein [Reticulomyxa filosa]|eukprot:ETO36015.1 CBS domain-containing protein [Reticulomyxa filosa]